MGSAARYSLLDSVVLLVSRLLLAWIFVHEGAFLAMNFNVAAAGMAKLGVPASVLVATIALQLAAGLAIAAGWHARLGAMALGVFCVLTAALFHTNFANRNELLHFEKDLAIAGGMFVLMLRGAGRFSIDAYAAAIGRHDKSVQATDRQIATEPSTSYDQKLAGSGRNATAAMAPETFIRPVGT